MDKIKNYLKEITSVDVVLISAFTLYMTFLIATLVNW